MMPLPSRLGTGLMNVVIEGCGVSVTLQDTVQRCTFGIENSRPTTVLA